MTPTVPQILKRLQNYRGFFPGKAVRAAVEQREQIIPELLRILDEAIEQPEVLDDDDYMAHIYALYLLAQFQEPAAYSRILRFFRLPDEIGVEATGDMVHEALPRMLAYLNGGDIRPIQQLIEDPEASEWVRAAAVGALGEMVHGGLLSRDEVVGYLGELLNGKLESKASYAWDSTASLAVDLHPEELKEPIYRAYKRGLLDPMAMHPDEVGEALRRPKAEVIAESKRRSRGPIEDSVEEMEGWYCFQHPPAWSMPASEPEGLETTLPDLPTGRSIESDWAVKIGRNDPCPCGSGKKYKKCCLRAEA